MRLRNIPSLWPLPVFELHDVVSKGGPEFWCMYDGQRFSDGRRALLSSGLMIFYNAALFFKDEYFYPSLFMNSISWDLTYFSIRTY